MSKHVELHEGTPPEQVLAAYSVQEIRQRLKGAQNQLDGDRQMMEQQQRHVDWLQDILDLAESEAGDCLTIRCLVN